MRADRSARGIFATKRNAQARRLRKRNHVALSLSRFRDGSFCGHGPLIERMQHVSNVVLVRSAEHSNFSVKDVALGAIFADA
jgi:hypothetical protein